MGSTISAFKSSPVWSFCLFGIGQTATGLVGTSRPVATSLVETWSATCQHCRQTLVLFKDIILIISEESCFSHFMLFKTLQDSHKTS